MTGKRANDRLMSRSGRQRSLVGVIAAMAVVNLVYGITFPLMALVLDDQGVSKTLIGLSTVAQAAAVVLLAPWAPRLLRRFAPSRMMQVVTVVLSVLFIIAGLIPNVWFWFPLRFVIGALIALLWISSEALINDLAEERWRGRVIGLYASFGAAGFALGPLLLIITGSSGMLPFFSTSTLVLLAGIPIFMVSHRQLKHSGESAHGFWKIFLLAPAVMIANAVYAATAESQLTFFPIFAISLNVSENFSLGLMSIMGLGAMILVMPLSWLADHVDRMGFLAICVLLTMVGFWLMPQMIQFPVIGSVFMFAFGGVEGMIYALGVILVGEHFKGAMLAAATTMFTAFWGAGTVVGPLLTGVGMDHMGADQMALMLFLMFGLFLPLPVISWWRNRGARVHESD
jgi:MFS family permease